MTGREGKASIAMLYETYTMAPKQIHSDTQTHVNK